MTPNIEVSIGNDGGKYADAKFTMDGRTIGTVCLQMQPEGGWSLCYVDASQRANRPIVQLAKSNN